MSVKGECIALEDEALTIKVENQWHEVQLYNQQMQQLLWQNDDDDNI